MKKYILALLLVTLVVPTVASAAWWNPFSWGFFNRSPQAQSQNLEDRIKELEKQLEMASSSPTPPLPATKEKVSPAPVVTNSQSSRVYTRADFLALVTKYSKLRDKVTKDMGNISSEPGQANAEHKTFLIGFLKQVDLDLTKINALNGLKSLPARTMELYNLTEFSRLSKIYGAEIIKYNRNLTKEYFSVNKEILHVPGTHVQAQTILEAYDRSFGTKYAPAFAITKTQQETVNFANMLLGNIK